MNIKDSGKRREFDSGAVRDIQEGKGRMDLLPINVISALFEETEKGDELSYIFTNIASFQYTGCIDYLIFAMKKFIEIEYKGDYYTAVLELALHYEEGAKKYVERNWERGIPVHCYVDSGIRHLMKHSRGDNDEPHNRAFLWNMACAVWTMQNLPELDDFTFKKIVE